MNKDRVKITLYKYQGAGNDFLIADNRGGSVQLSRERIAALCDRRYGVGADGLMLLAKHSNLEVMTQHVDKNATVWLTPGTGEDDFEFFFVHKGEIEINLDGENMVFHAGDSADGVRMSLTYALSPEGIIVAAGQNGVGV